MKAQTICKTIHQYNKFPIPEEEMQKLQEIAQDYRTVKNEVYRRYGGKNSLLKIYPGYTVQREMSRTDLRDRLGLPSAYFNVAVLDALGDIKTQWTGTKKAVLKRVNANEGFSQEDKHYLRFVLKVSNVFEMVLNGQERELKAEVQEKYRQLAECVDAVKLDSYLKRQVRKFHTKLYAEKAEGFSVTERAYRYGDHGIYITMKEKRKRIFIELTENNRYDRQIYLRLYPERKSVELLVPIFIQIKQHVDYTSHVGLALGIHTMFVTDAGHCYGEQVGKYQVQLAKFVQEQTRKYALECHADTGRKKYNAKKNRMLQQLHSYINMELNRFLKEEQPEVVYVPKLPRIQEQKNSFTVGYPTAMWQRAYVRQRLRQKCMEQSIIFTEVFGKGISSECSQCGAVGSKEQGMFICRVCGASNDEKINAACNAKKRGEQKENLLKISS